MDIIVNISDSPVGGIKRKAKVKRFIWELEEGALQFIIEVIILRFKNESGEYGEYITPSLEYPLYLKAFTANNTTRLNPETGAILNTSDLTEGIGEYDALIYKMSQVYEGQAPLESVVSEIENSIIQADLRGQLAL